MKERESGLALGSMCDIHTLIYVYMYFVVVVVLFQLTIEVGYATPIIYVCIQREKENERARNMHTPVGQRPPGNPGSLSGHCMWQRSERVTGTHGIQSSHVGRTRASSDQAGRAGRLACCVLQCAAVCCCVLQCAAVCCSVLLCAAVCCCMLQSLLSSFLPAPP